MDRTLALLLFALALLWPAPTALAAAKSYTIATAEIEATVEPDGSLAVEEARTWSFAGSFTTAEQRIKFPAGSQVREVAVRETTGAIVKTYIESDSGEPGTFRVLPGRDQVRVRWHFQARDEVRKFVISYRVTDAVRLHNDVGELYWQFVGDGWKAETGAVLVRRRADRPVCVLPTSAKKV